MINEAIVRYNACYLDSNREIWPLTNSNDMDGYRESTLQSQSLDGYREAALQSQQRSGHTIEVHL